MYTETLADPLPYATNQSSNKKSPHIDYAYKPPATRVLSSSLWRGSSTDSLSHYTDALTFSVATLLPITKVPSATTHVLFPFPNSPHQENKRLSHVPCWQKKYAMFSLLDQVDMVRPFYVHQFQFPDNIIVHKL